MWTVKITIKTNKRKSRCRYERETWQHFTNSSSHCIPQLLPLCCKRSAAHYCQFSLCQQTKLFKAYVEHVNHQCPQQTADLVLSTPAVSLSQLSSLNKTKPDAHLSLAVKKRRSCQIWQKQTVKTAKECCTDGKISTPAIENTCGFFFPMNLSVNALASLVATWFLNVNSVKIQHLHLFFY